MTKRLLSFALALVMVLSMLPTVAIADGEVTPHVHCMCGATSVLDTECAKCGTKAVEWTAWGDGEGEADTLPKDGYYYLTKTVKTGMVEYKSANTAICLHGNDLVSLNGWKVMTVYNTATVSITDCAEEAGKITGCNKETYGLCLRVNEGGTLNLYGGHVTGNTGTATGDGVVYVDKGTTVPGGIFNMYGGEISGNTARRGGGIYTASGGTYPATVRILGGTITGNTGTGTGAVGGGAGVLSFFPVEIGGDAKVFGNTAAAGGADIFLRNDGTFAGKLVLSADKPLAEGAQLNYSLKTAEADTTDIKSIEGAPTDWDSKWLRYDGNKVAYADGKFSLDMSVDHIHCLCGAETEEGKTCAKCGSTAATWTGINKMPAVTEAGWYYLTTDVTVSPMFYNGIEIAFCLCGHTMTSAEGKRMMDAQNGAVISITDCSETAGKITGATGATNNGSVLRVNAESFINLYNGKITGNTGNSDGIVYAAEGTTTAPGGTFTMYGGEVSNNTVRRGAVYTALGTNGKLGGKLRLLGGTITGNTGAGTGAVGGGAGVYSFYPVEIGGDLKVYGNTASTGNADLYLREDQNQNASLVLSTEVPLTEGAQIEYGSKNADNAAELKLITGAPANWDATWVTYNGDNVDYADGKFFINTIVPEGHIHCKCGKEATYNATCASCGTKAVLWLPAEAGVLPNASGNYYLTGDVSTGAVTFTGATNTSICLHGHTVSSLNGWKIMNVEKGATVSITDCSENVGVITGGNRDNYGLCLRVNGDSTLNLYNGKITGNTGSETGDGIIYVDRADASATTGGIFNMYGGEISGNVARRGSAVFGALPSAGQKAPVIRLLGGTITGNQSTGTGSVTGGAVTAFTPVEIGGDVKIYGNTAAVAGAEDVFLRNDGYNGKLVLSSTKPLTDGAKINYSLKTAEADNTNLQSITGTPEGWSDNWITYNGEKVSYSDGKFTTAKEIIFSGHQHGDHQWISVTNENKQWPSGDGYYVLEEDVQLKQILTVLKGNHVHLCLNGHTLTAAEGAGHYDLRGGSKLTICDCTAKTDKDGNYTAGKITGGKGSNGGVIRARAGSEVYLENGIMEGNETAGNGGFIYMDAQSDLFPGAVFVMTGGKICGNKGAYGAGVRLGAPSADMAGPTFRMEGGVICCNESPNHGGGLHCAGGATIDLIGGVIENNVAALGGGGLSVNGNSVINLSGTVIRGNSVATWGGGVYIKTGAVMNMTGGEISGNSSKVGAGILLESLGTTLNLSGGKITGNKAGAAGGAGFYASTNTIVNMTGGEISYNESESGGGGGSIAGGTGNFTGGKIIGNKGASGAGMRLTGTETLLGKVVISGNVSTGSAGGVYVAREGSVFSNVTIDGAEITKNECKSSGGGIFLYMNGNAITMKSGKISGNKAQDGGGVVAQREVTFTLEGGEISGNTSTGSGGGFYSSIDATFIMNGGSITGNYSEKSGGGLVVLRGKAKLNGGSVSYNTSKGSAAGININGSYVTMSGTWVTHNKATEASGSGVMVQSTTAKVDGVNKRFAGYLAIYGGVISENFTPKAGAGLLLQREDTVVDMYGGKITKNTATKFAAGVYVGSKSHFKMHGGEISYNVTENDVAAGIRHDGGFGTYTGGEIFGNVTTRSGGGIIVGGTGNKVTMKNVKIYDNSAKVGGGVLLQSKEAELIMEDCEIYDNKATQEGAGIYIYTYCNFTANNCHIHDNVVQGNGAGLWSWATSFVYLNDCLIENNKAEGQGGAIWTRNDGFFIDGCTIKNNTAEGDGGAIYAGRMSAASDGFFPHMNISNTVIENNTSGGQGGGAYMSTGAMCHLTDVTFLNNTAAAEAGAIWAKDEFSMHNVTATGNVSGGEGHAVYLADSEYDGHSYIAGLMEMSGNMQIHDNVGGDLYLGKQTTLTITELGISEDAKVNVTLHSGLLTQMVWGAYNYEGGDQVYTITYGNRSIVDPEIPQAQPDETEPVEGTEDTQQTTEPVEQTGNGNAVIYVGIAAFVAVILAAVGVVIGLNLKKKKASAK